MPRITPWPSMAATSFVLLFFATPLIAGVASGESVPISVDVDPPDILFAQPRAGSILYGFSATTFTWTVSDDHPSGDLHPQVLGVIVSGEAYETATIPAQDGVNSWDWEVPNISSGINSVVVSVRDAFGNIATRNSPDFMILLDNTGIIDPPPRVAHLDAPYPNPFNPITTVEFGLPADGHARITVTDLRGRHVRTLVDEPRAAGTWNVTWDGMNYKGRHVAAGPYLLLLEKDGVPIRTRKVVLLP